MNSTFVGIPSRFVANQFLTANMFPLVERCVVADNASLHATDY
jgi:hypothetical protein